MEKNYARYRMQIYKKPMLKDNACTFMNIGESIQFLAMDNIFRQIGLSQKDIIDISADEIMDYHGVPLLLPAKFILNDRPINRILPFPEGIQPIFMSSVMLRNEEIHPELIDYLKHHQPIGCRDEQARTMLRNFGIEAYLMGCFTICFPKRKSTPSNGKVFLVDVSENLETFIPEHLKKDAIRISHAIPTRKTIITIEEDNRLNRLAAELLKRYEQEASLVITSRLHAAAPCIAMGIPVILASDNIDFRYSWIDKFTTIYTLDEYSQIDWNPKPVDTSKVKQWIPMYLKKRIDGDPTAKDELAYLDDYYMDRHRADYYGYFRRRIASIKDRFLDGKFTYIIWGAGLHSGYTYDLIREIYPNANLKAVIDKYEEGQRFGLDIIREKDLNQIQFDFAFITTKPGTLEAIAKMENIFGADAQKHYMVITSQQNV